MDWSNSGRFEKPQPNAPVPQAPLDGVASPEEEATLARQAHQDATATRDRWVWTANLDCQDPKGKRVHQDTQAPGEIRGKKELLGLQGPQGFLGCGALQETLGRMDPGGHQAPRVQRDPQGSRVSLVSQERRETMGPQANLGPLGPQGPRESKARQDLQERRE